MPSLICPFCSAPLTRVDRVWTCPAGHSFDIAREGYVNLLPVQWRNSKDPGDSREMVQARRDFLAAGYYDPLRDAVAARLAALGVKSLLDAGCGEGHYTGAFTGAVPDVTGLDLSKPAVQLAARRFPACTWIVGNTALIPLADRSLDAVTNLFCQPQAAEYHRVLRPGGALLVATPAEGHLHELRAALFDEVRPHEPDKFTALLAPRFTPAGQEEIRFALHLDAPALRALLLMTPYAWKARLEKRQALEQQPGLKTTAAFRLLVFTRE
jgi:23S rRNA (guanine745-N1)-methyltransferase